MYKIVKICSSGIWLRHRYAEKYPWPCKYETNVSPGQDKYVDQTARCIGCCGLSTFTYMRLAFLCVVRLIYERQLWMHATCIKHLATYLIAVYGIWHFHKQNDTKHFCFCDKPVALQPFSSSLVRWSVNFDRFATGPHPVIHWISQKLFCEIQCITGYIWFTHQRRLRSACASAQSDQSSLFACGFYILLAIQKGINENPCHTGGGGGGVRGMYRLI